MEYPYKLAIQSEKLNKEFVVPSEKSNIKLGNSVNCEARFSRDIYECEVELDFVRDGEKWIITASDNLYITGIYNTITNEEKNRGIKTVSFTGTYGDVFQVFSSDDIELFKVLLAIDFDATVHKINNYIDISKTKSIRVSSDEAADLIITSPYGNGNDIVINNNGVDYILSCSKAPFGISVNGKSINENVRLSDNDYISFSDVELFYLEGKIFFDTTIIKCSQKQVYTLQNEGIFEYPGFIRNTRIKKKISNENIKILEPSNLPEEPESNIFSRIIPAIIMLVLCILFRAVLNPSRSTFVIFSICSMGMGVITSVVSIVRSKKKYRKNVRLRRENYIKYVEEKRASISKIRQQELDALRDRYYSNRENLEHILSFDTCLFDRDKMDEDFLDVYLGTGLRKAIRAIDYKEKEQLTEGDELTKIPMELATNFTYIDQAPITLNIRNAGAVGITGSEKAIFDVFKNMIVDICARQYYSDVKIVCLVDEDRYKAGVCDFLKYIPHIQVDNNGEDTRRFIVIDETSKTSVFDYLYKVLSSREAGVQSAPHYIIFALADYGMRMHPLMKYVEHAGDMSATFVFFEKRVQLLPQYCKYVIELNDDNSGKVYDSSDADIFTDFDYEEISDEDMTEMAIKLAPVYAEEISLSGDLKKKISLFELYGLFEIDDLNLSQRWKSSKVYESMAVPLGINSKEQVISLDLHEKWHGPHGLVAGTTGSGKSELLQSYILGAAMSFPPDEVGFLIIDFKGGGMANQFADLPHLLGTITNLEGKEVDRSLKAIKAELIKRQNCFSEAGVNHIDKYIELYKVGKVIEPLPHLIIVVDEFAELKAEQPDFMKELISTARIGRSLGVHLILATQKPAGQVNEQIWSNSRFKICLKVQNQSDSNEVLKSPLAAEIREPGRAYLQVGNNEIFELIQSGFSGAPEKAVDQESRAYRLYELDFTGEKKLIFEKVAKKQKASRTQLEAVVDYIKSYCENMKVTVPDSICMPPLSDNIDYESSKDKSIIVGYYDNPDEQTQGLLEISLSENTMILGAARMGKTNLLMTIIRNICEKYTVEEANLYILDFSSMLLRNFARLEHVGGVVCASDDEKLKSLIRMLYEVLSTRRNKLLATNSNSYAAYCKAGYKDMPRLVIIVDNFSALKETYPEETEQMLGLLRDGLSVGICFIFTNNQFNGIGYKFMSQISGRISFYLNDTASYSGFIGSRGITPDEKIGRCITSINKSTKECQIYNAFGGDTEEVQNENLQNWIEVIANKTTGNSKAISIPEIPNILLEKEMEWKENKIRLGLAYSDIQLVNYNVDLKNVLVVMGREHFGQTNFIKHVISDFRKINPKGDLLIFDDYRHKYSDYSPIAIYADAVDEMLNRLIEVGAKCAEEYELMTKNSNFERSEKLIVINNADVIDAICKNKESAAVYKDMIGKYKALGIYIIISCLSNATIGVMSNDILKNVKDSKHLMYFDDLSNLKLFDVSVMIGRNYKKKIEIGDAYYFNGTDINKLKTPLCVE